MSKPYIHGMTEAKHIAHAAQMESAAMAAREERLITENARLREAAIEYVQAMEGFADAARENAGLAYPWPAQKIALAKLLAVLDPDDQKERRVTALSDLAEMDAVLLDLPIPEAQKAKTKISQ